MHIYIKMCVCTCKTDNPPTRLCSNAIKLLAAHYMQAMYFFCVMQRIYKLLFFYRNFLLRGSHGSYLVAAKVKARALKRAKIRGAALSDVNASAE